jgi:hypothetical protein
MQVWQAMLTATKRPSTPILEQLAQQKAAGHKSSSKAAKKKGSSQQADASLAAAAARLRKLAADGLPSWTADISWVDDPFDAPDAPVVNKVCSTIRVEVITAELV